MNAADVMTNVLSTPPQETLIYGPAGAALLAPPPLALEVGSIVTLRMRGHTRTQGLEYFSPAVVLHQHSPGGELEVLIWDPTAGTHYNSNYPIRELANRDVEVKVLLNPADPSLGVTCQTVRQQYESQSNIGQVLFSPLAFQNVLAEVDILSHELRQKHQLLKQLVDRVNRLEAYVDSTRSQKPSSAPSDAKPSAVVSDATASDKRK